MAENGWVDDADEADDQAHEETEGKPIPYEASDLTEELAGEQLPEWFGVRWRDIPVEDQAEAWVWLRRWVEWLVLEYRLPSEVVPPCWFLHADTTAELYAAMCLEHKVYESEAPSIAPTIYWQAQLPQIRDRLFHASHQPCQREHVPTNEAKFLRPVDEQAWQETISARHVSTRFERPEKETRYLRAVIEDEDEETLTHTGSIGLRAHRTEDEPAAVLRFNQVPGEADEMLHLHVEKANAVAAIRWEQSTDNKTWTSLEGDGAEE